MPVLARNCVATSQPLAAQAGLRMLLKGGSAVDAVLATAIALTVLEPTSNGIGSDAFAILWDGKQLRGLNASGRSPAAWTPERFKGTQRCRKRGWDAVTVPGCVSAWVEMSKQYGKLPFADLFEPAIEYAAGGYMVTPTIARLWATPGGRTQVAARLRADLHAEGPRAASRRNVRVPRSGTHAAAHRRNQRRSVLPRRSRRKNRRAFETTRRRDDDGRSRRAHASTGSSRSRKTIAATRCTKSRPTARA